ncbi:MAG: HDOD domain-containing protein [Firmicutes bacterium]|nr:HDOD domain-containing protein [Dethiobacter sp.]MBS3888491.1 HDOD domain-containing protein [Bacillota bacterium]
MEVYVGRQPIFDKRMKTYGYELLYRRSQNNVFEGLSDSQATAELINHAYFVMHLDELTSGTRAFINFSSELLEREVPLLLPKKNLVVEVLERVLPTEAVVAACRKLVSQGYVLALDDYVHREEMLPLLELSSIVKLELSSLRDYGQRQFFSQYKGRKCFVAEKLDTQAEFDVALKMGFDLFQGYFFSKPAIVAGREITSLNTTLVQIISALENEEPDYQDITAIIERDVGLMYKLLKLANSAAYGTVQRILSIEQALVRIGLLEFRKWVYLMILMETQGGKNQELVKTSLVRAKLMEELTRQQGGARGASLTFLLACSPRLTPYLIVLWPI